MIPNLKKGTKLVVIANTSGHGIPIGTKAEFSHYYNNGGGCGGGSKNIFLIGYPSWCAPNDVKLASYNLESLTDDLTNAEKAVVKLKMV